MSENSPSDQPEDSQEANPSPTLAAYPDTQVYEPDPTELVDLASPVSDEP